MGCGLLGNPEDPWERCPDTSVSQARAGDAPIARFPPNGATTGSVWATDDALGVLPRRPVFRWESVPGATTYELELDDSCAFPGFVGCTFPSPELSLSTEDTQLVPAEDLP